jgi:hypothetical protein
MLDDEPARQISLALRLRAMSNHFLTINPKVDLLVLTESGLASKYPPTPVSNMPDLTAYILETFVLFVLRGCEWRQICPEHPRLRELWVGLQPTLPFNFDAPSSFSY